MLSHWKPAPAGYKHVVSVSLGSSKRDAREETELLGQKFVLERIGTDGDMKKLRDLLLALDGKVSAFGLGGTDIYIVAGDKRYTFREIAPLVAGLKTPIVDGSGLKHTLEREAIKQLEPLIHWKGCRTLLVSSVDRFGMAEALSEAGANVLYGDIVFGLNLNVPLRSMNSIRKVAKVILPALTFLPFKWFYPTGEKQEQSVQGVGTQYYEWAEVIAGDTHYVKRYAPDKLEGKTILTQTITEADREWARQHGVKRLITTTPRIGSRNFATNVMEAMLVASQDAGAALSEAQYRDLLLELDFRPQVTEF
ncbi:quinate 5-dehydrogenase [Deinococcus psychrotolerans]|uniref:Quinate 5-dehydrogenase n=1 Tax=Deinococcus psychrotolerans TaxID=2489213 RepID=A0A3G8YEH2_9DEIO|nr:quinate 5-dehydrogenase [Deinococcus psychrotolerans]AZI43712.1 quinate 5-dehydrogenase [Deinococcus psychrotolerans]